MLSCSRRTSRQKDNTGCQRPALSRKETRTCRSPSTPSPAAPQCDATYRALDKQGVSYEKIDVTQDAESLAFIKGLGYQQAPVVVAGEDHWSGFRPDRIKAIAAAALAMSA